MKESKASPALPEANPESNVVLGLRVAAGADSAEQGFGRPRDSFATSRSYVSKFHCEVQVWDGAVFGFYRVSDAQSCSSKPNLLHHSPPQRGGAAAKSSSKGNAAQGTATHKGSLASMLFVSVSVRLPICERS